MRASRVSSFARILAIACAGLCGVVPSAHGVDFLGLDPGIRAGVSLSRLSLNTTPDGVDTQFHPGFLVGATLAYNRLPIVGLELQVAYFEQGGEFEIRDFEFSFAGRDTIVNGQVKVKTSYLMIPFLVNVKAPGAIARPYAKVASQVGFRLAADAELEPIEGIIQENDLKDDTNVVDYSLYFAGGLEFPLTTFSAFVEVGYGLGLTDVFKEDQNLGGPVNAKNRVVAISVGLSY